MKSFLELKKAKKDCSNETTMEQVQIYFNFLNKITIITNFLAFFFSFNFFLPDPYFDC